MNQWTNIQAGPAEQPGRANLIYALQ